MATVRALHDGQVSIPGDRGSEDPKVFQEPFDSVGSELRELLVGMLGFNSQLHLASLTNPVVFAFNERVVMNAFAIVRCANVAFHRSESLRTGENGRLTLPCFQP